MRVGYPVVIDKITKIATGEGKTDPLARLAVLSIPFLLTIIGALLGGQLSEIKAGVNGNRMDIIVIQRSLDVQQQILQGNIGATVDQETRIRALERWQDAVSRP